MSMQTRLDHANLMGGLLRRFAGAPPVVWAVHSTDWVRCAHVEDPPGATLLRAPVASSTERDCLGRASSAALYAKLGFSAAKLRVVPNGVDAAAFRPDHGRQSG